MFPFPSTPSCSLPPWIPQEGWQRGLPAPACAKGIASKSFSSHSSRTTWKAEWKASTNCCFQNLNKKDEAKCQIKQVRVNIPSVLNCIKEYCVWMGILDFLKLCLLNHVVIFFLSVLALSLWSPNRKDLKNPIHQDKMGDPDILGDKLSIFLLKLKTTASKFLKQGDSYVKFESSLLGLSWLICTHILSKYESSSVPTPSPTPNWESQSAAAFCTQSLPSSLQHYCQAHLSTSNISIYTLEYLSKTEKPLPFKACPQTKLEFCSNRNGN